MGAQYVLVGWLNGPSQRPPPPHTSPWGLSTPFHAEENRRNRLRGTSCNLQVLQGCLWLQGVPRDSGGKGVCPCCLGGTLCVWGKGLLIWRGGNHSFPFCFPPKISLGMARRGDPRGGRHSVEGGTRYKDSLAALEILQIPHPCAPSSPLLPFLPLFPPPRRPSRLAPATPTLSPGFRPAGACSQWPRCLMR